MRWKLRRRVNDAIDAHYMRRSDSVVADGLWIGALDDAGHRSLDRVRNAVRLIAECDPVRYRRLLRDIDSIWVRLLPGNAAQYEHDRRRIVLSRRHIADKEDEVIATYIVHEATHARLNRFGYEEGVRGRIERCCIRRELAFARKLPDGQYLVDWFTPLLATPDVEYSDASVEARQRQEVMELAGNSRVLRAFFRAVLWLRDRRNRKGIVGSK